MLIQHPNVIQYGGSNVQRKHTGLPSTVWKIMRKTLKLFLWASLLFSPVRSPLSHRYDCNAASVLDESSPFVQISIQPFLKTKLILARLFLFLLYSYDNSASLMEFILQQDCHCKNQHFYRQFPVHSFKITEISINLINLWICLQLQVFKNGRERLRSFTKSSY